MLERINHIEIDSVVYPLVYNFNVIEKIEERYDTVEEWINTLQSQKIKAKDVKFALMTMINEGIDIENDALKEERKPLTEKQTGRILSDFAQALGAIIDITCNSVEVSEGKN